MMKHWNGSALLCLVCVLSLILLHNILYPSIQSNTYRNVPSVVIRVPQRPTLQDPTEPQFQFQSKQQDVVYVSHGGSKHDLKVKSLVNHHIFQRETQPVCDVRNVVDVNYVPDKRERASMPFGKPKSRELISPDVYGSGNFPVVGAENDSGMFEPNFESFTLCPKCLTKYYSNVCLWNGTIYADQEAESQYKVWTYAGTIIFNLSTLSSLPMEVKNQTVFSEAPAFFAWMPCEGNLFHMIFQTFAPLYTLLSFQGLMGREVFNRKIDFYADRPFGYDIVKQRYDTDFRHGMCRSPKYLSMFDLLPVNLEYDYYGDSRFENQLRCYRHSFFGFDERIDHKKIIPSLNFARRYLVNQTRCEALSSPPGTLQILMIQRHHRRISNIEDLDESAKALGRKLNSTIVTKVVALEDLEFIDQMELFSCWADVMVGVQGAGMAWGYFMREHKGLIEIGWRKWECRYDGRLKFHLSTKCIRLEDDLVKTNLTNFMKDTDIFKDLRYVKYSNFSELPEEDQQVVLEQVKLNPYGFTPKYADVQVPVSSFERELKMMILKMRRKKLNPLSRSAGRLTDKMIPKKSFN
jgi:hypothetical protein